MLQLRTRESLSGGDYGWLKARHHFAVDARAASVHGPLGSLVVWNDDEFAPGTGFPMHGHKNMEIITYVRTGAVAHEDSLGNVGRIEAGDVQVMRVPRRRARERARRVETRIPGGDVNPYLAFAALIASGLHGIEQELEAALALPRQRVRVGRGALPLDDARGHRGARERDDGEGRLR